MDSRTPAPPGAELVDDRDAFDSGRPLAERVPGRDTRRKDLVDPPHLAWEPVAVGILVAAQVASREPVEVRIGALTSLLEPVMIVAMGGGVAFIVFSILMPIMQLTSFVPK